MSKEIAAISLEMFEKAKKYWMQKLSGEITAPEFSSDFPSPQADSKDRLKMALGKNQSKKIIHLSNNNDLLLYVLLMASLKIMLYKYTGQDDMIVSAPTLKKSTQSYNRWIILRDFLHPRMTFRDLLMKVKDTVFAGFENQYYPVHKLMKLLDIHESKSLSRITLLLEGLHGKESPGLEADGFAPDLVFSFEQRDEELQGEVIYNKNFFQVSTIHSMCFCYSHVLNQVLNHTGIKIANIQLIPEEEKKKILSRFNHPQTDSRVDKTIHQLFADQVKKTPTSPAVQLETSQYWTYQELNNRANRLAKELKQRGVAANCPVGLMIERSAHALLGMLGIVKAGGAYLPIDPGYPADRINFMLKDSRTKVLLTRENIHAAKEKLDTYKDLHGLDILLLDENNTGSEENLDSVKKDTQPGNLFYIIYTSGSTGRPKGVLIPHRNFVHLIHFHKELFQEGHGTRMSQVTSLGFDAAAFEIWPCLLNGGILYIADESTRSDPAAMRQWLIKNKINISFQSTLMAERLLQENWPKTGNALKVLMTAGDRLKSYPPLDCPFRFYNLYGPTEDTVWTTWTEVEPEKNTPATKYPTIGRPVKHKHVFILGVDNQLLPIGAAGELCISGPGLAPGYLNQPELTTEKFIELDFKVEQDIYHRSNRSYMSYNSYKSYKSYYKTGDLAKWVQDGDIQFLGRIDQQVKVRGFRIELGEIENRLSAYPGINRALVTDYTDITGDNYLCAYIVSTGKEANTPGADELKKYLARFLPDYMIPSFFVFLEELPLTPNGKTDRKNLPVPQFKSAAAYAPPGNKLEEKLAEMWQEILGADIRHLSQVGIGIDDNFFELGGHSLKATNLISKIHKVFKIRLSLSEFFKTPYIRQIAQYIQHSTGEEYIPLEPVEKKEYRRLSSAHKRLYILQELESDSIAYNMSAVLSLEGEPDRERLEQTFKKLIHRHESFCTSFYMMDNEPVQRTQHEVEFEIEYNQSLVNGHRSLVNCQGRGEVPSPIKVENVIKNFIRPFDLSRAPLLRVGLIGPLHTPAAHRSHPRQDTHNSQEGKKDRYILMVDMHHIISDGTSIGILIDDFMALYSGNTLPELPIGYKDYTQWQEKIKKSQFMKKQEEYWLHQLAGELKELNLPHDFPRPEIRQFKGQRLEFSIPEHQVDSLKQLALEQETTLYVVMLALVNIFLAKLSGQEDIIIGTAVANRRHADLEHIIGMFVNTLIIRNYPRADLTVSEFLHQIKDTTINAHENQEFSFDDLVEKIIGKKARDAARNPLFDVLFALQNMEIPEIQLPGLKLSPYSYETGISQFDLVLIGFEERKKLKMQFIYSSNLFRKQTVQRFIRYFQEVIDTVLENKQIKILDIEISHDLREPKAAIFQEARGDFSF